MEFSSELAFESFTYICTNLETGLPTTIIIVVFSKAGRLKGKTGVYTVNRYKDGVRFRFNPIASPSDIMLLARFTKAADTEVELES